MSKLVRRIFNRNKLKASTHLDDHYNNFLDIIAPIIYVKNYEKLLFSYAFDNINNEIIFEFLTDQLTDEAERLKGSDGLQDDRDRKQNNLFSRILFWRFIILKSQVFSANFRNKFMLSKTANQGLTDVKYFTRFLNMLVITTGCKYAQN